MEWVASILHTTSEHGVSGSTTADAHTSAASNRLNWRPRRFKWTRPFRRKTKSGFCACAITFKRSLLLSVELLGQGLDNQGIVDRFPAETIAFRFVEASTPTMKPTHPSFHWDTVALSSGAKRLGREAQSQRELICVPGGGGNKETQQRASYARWLLAASAVNSTNHYLIVSVSTETDKSICNILWPRAPFRTLGPR
jgi:hypothetical protein